MDSPLQLEGPQIALVAPERLHQACWARPAFKAIQAHFADATIVCPEEHQDFWALSFTKILTIPTKSSPRAAAQILSKAQFQSAVLLEHNLVAQAFGRLSEVWKFGPKQPEDLAKLLDYPVASPSDPAPPEHKITPYLKLAEALHCPVDQPSFFAPPNDRQKPQLRQVAISCDSDFGTAAAWPQQHVLELIQTIAAEQPTTFHLLAPPLASMKRTEELAELLTTENIAHTLQAPHESTVGSILEQLATMSVLITSHNTLAHLAAHLGLPTLTLFGPHSPITDRPLGKIHQNLSTFAECSPCNLAKCPLDHRCLYELKPATVFAAYQKLIAH